MIDAIAFKFRTGTQWVHLPETARVPGSVITRRIGGLSCRFELTDTPLGDGTYAAEPLDHL